jgi:hypothetical protein
MVHVETPALGSPAVDASALPSTRAWGASPSQRGRSARFPLLYHVVLAVRSPGETASSRCAARWVRFPMKTPR